LKTRIDEEEDEQRTHQMRMAEAKHSQDEFNRMESMFRGYQQQPTIEGMVPTVVPVQGVTVFGIGPGGGQPAASGN